MKKVLMPRIGFRRTRAQRSGTQSAAADGTRTRDRWLFEMRRRGSLNEGFARKLRAYPCSCKSWPRRHKADGGQEEVDGCILRGGQRIGLVERQITVVDL